MYDSLPPFHTCTLTQACKPVTSAHTDGPRAVIPEFSASWNAVVLWPLPLTTDQEIRDPLFLWVSPSFQTFLIKNKGAKVGIPGVPTSRRSTEPQAQTFWGSHAPVLFDLVEASSSVPWRKERQLVRLLDWAGVWRRGSPWSRTHWVVGMQGILNPSWYFSNGGTLRNYPGERVPERTVVWRGQDMNHEVKMRGDACFL